jgi:acyl-CoA hydrolase
VSATAGGPRSSGRLVIAYADGIDSARSSPAVVAAAAGESGAGDDVELVMGWTPEGRDWLSSPKLRGRTIMAGYALTDAIAAGRIKYLPVRLSAVRTLVAGILRPHVAVVTGVRRGSDLVFGLSAGWGPALARAADRVVVEVDEHGLDLGGPPIPGNIVATLERPAGGPPPVPRPPGPVDVEIARHVMSVLPEEPTLQVGPGGVAEAILAALDRPVRVWSGLITDAVATLHSRHLLSEVATTAYVWGGRPTADLAAEGRLALLPTESTHDLTRLSGLERFVGCNTAIQVGLDGSVNVERVGDRMVAGMGGHPDFCVAATRSVGGLSIVALASTTMWW